MEIVGAAGTVYFPSDTIHSYFQKIHRIGLIANMWDDM